MFKITAPTPFTGVGYGLHFVEGVAHTDNEKEFDRLRAKLEPKGYTFEAEGMETAVDWPVAPVLPPPTESDGGAGQNDDGQTDNGSDGQAPADAAPPEDGATETPKAPRKKSRSETE